MTNTEAKFNLLNLQETCSPVQADTSIAASNHHQSAQLIGWNDDLLAKIFIHLPAKSILRFKSVSKQWLSLLTHPRFTLLFDKLSISSGLYYHEEHVSFDVENPTTPPFRCLNFSPADTHFFRIVQSCNGLLLCCCNKDYWCSGNYYVFNFTTNKFASVPRVIGSPLADKLIRLMGLAYHPTECVHYKLVCILRAGDTEAGKGFNEEGYRMYNIQIYSSHTGKWKKLNQTFTPLGYTVFRYGVYWNGAFHWALSCQNPMYLRLDAEQIQELPLPSPLPKKKRGYYSPYSMPLYFGESRDHLHLVDASHEKNPLGINVYEMLGDHSGWFIKYQLDFSELSIAYPSMTHNKWPTDKYEFRVLDLVRGGEEEEDTFMVVKALDNIKRYNILHKTFQDLFCIPDNIEKVRGNGTKTFTKTFHGFVGHRYIEKIGSF